MCVSLSLCVLCYFLVGAMLISGGDCLFVAGGSGHLLFEWSERARGSLLIVRCYRSVAGSSADVGMADP